MGSRCLRLGQRVHHIGSGGSLGRCRATQLSVTIALPTMGLPVSLYANSVQKHLFSYFMPAIYRKLRSSLKKVGRGADSGYLYADSATTRCAAPNKTAIITA